MPARDLILELKQRIGESITGQEAVIDRLLIALLADGLEQEGTYPLPEAQTDRFLMKVLLG
jgi:MoxR-like ATPase